MKYTQDEFFRLMEAIEEEGGEHLDETHDAMYHTKFTGDKMKGLEVHYCGLDVMFDVPYVGLDINGQPMQVQPVKVCAVDDMVGRWPRFSHANAKGTP